MEADFHNEPRIGTLIEAFGRHPADLAADAFERREVVRLRGQGVSWAHISAQLGRPEVSLRRLYAAIIDHPPLPAPKVAPPAPAAAVAPPYGPARFRAPVSVRIMLALEAEGWRMGRDLAALTGGERPAIGVALTNLKGRGLVRNLDAGTTRPGRYALTATGRRAAAVARTEVTAKGSVR